MVALCSSSASSLGLVRHQAPGECLKILLPLSAHSVFPKEGTYFETHYVQSGLFWTSSLLSNATKLQNFVIDKVELIKKKVEVRRRFITMTVREQRPRSHHKSATGRVRTGDQRYSFLCRCQLRHDIPDILDDEYFGSLLLNQSAKSSWPNTFHCSVLSGQNKS